MQEQAEADKHFERPIRELLKKFFSEEDFKIKHMGEIDISAPILEDMRAVQSGTYDIRLITITPNPNNVSGNAINFYVGQTEFHIVGDAADMISDQAR